MIISHEHRFIFFRTEKTAGTSIEYALAELCGPGDTATGIRADLAKRRGLVMPWSKSLPISTGAFRKFLPRYFGFHTHATAAQAKALLPRRTFDSYYKFAVERNPWDRQISLYFHRVKRHSQLKLDFNRDMNSSLYRACHHARLKNWEVYTIKDEIVVDEVLRFENLTAGLARVAELLALPEVPQLGNRRSGYRPNGGYRDFYTPPIQRLVGDWYFREIQAFGYEF